MSVFAYQNYIQPGPKGQRKSFFFPASSMGGRQAQSKSLDVRPSDLSSMCRDSVSLPKPPPVKKPMSILDEAEIAAKDSLRAAAEADAYGKGTKVKKGHKHSANKTARKLSVDVSEVRITSGDEPDSPNVPGGRREDVKVETGAPTDFDFDVTPEARKARGRLKRWEARLRLLSLKGRLR